jgi:hypothetical protein
MDNYYRECPGIMSDGRIFTDWRLATRRNEYIKYINNITRDDDYRMFLQENTDDILSNEWTYNKKNVDCHENSCIHVYPTRSLPQYFKQEINDFNSHFNSSIPKYVKECPVYDDYRMTPNVNKISHNTDEQEMSYPYVCNDSEFVK